MNVRHGRGRDGDAGRTRRRRWGWRLLWLSLLAVLAAPFVLVWLLVDDHAVVREPNLLGTEDAHRARELAERTYRRIAETTGPGELVFTEQELNGLAALGARAVPGLRGRVNITPWALESAASIAVPAGPWGRYVNVRAGVEPSSSGIRFSHLSIGDIDIPGRFAVGAVRTLGNLVMGGQRGSLLLDTVRAVELDSGRAVLHVYTSAALQHGDRLFEAIHEEVGSLADPQRIGVYHDRLEALDAQPGGALRVSLASYLGPLFALAAERSRDGDPVAENEALIYAVSTYFGSYRIGTLTGVKRGAEAGEATVGKGSPRLGGREDLRLHFLISAGLELLSNHDVSIAIGEFKELLDTEASGSGFSFTDLAADRAGVRFAEVATADARSARRLQQVLADNGAESVFFPPLDGLRDGLSQREFEQVYGGVHGRRYQATVADIDARISALPAYRP